MARIKGREVRVEISLTDAAAKVVSAVTKASPPVATSTAHGLAAGAVGYMSGVGGMTLLEGQAVRVAAPTADTFQMPGLNTTTHATYTGGNFIPINTWASFGTLTSYEMSGGDGIETDVGTIHDEVDQIEYGGLNAQSFTFNGLSEDSPGAAMQALENAAISQSFVVFRITYKTGAQRVFRGQPSLPTESLSKGEVGTGSFGAVVKGRVLKLAPVA